MEYQELKAEVISFLKEGNICSTVLQLDRLPPGPIAPASLYDFSNAKSVEFELHKVLRVDMNTVTFETYDVGDKQLLLGETYIFRSWGWNSRELELVKNNTISWLREKFKPTDALEFRDENGYLSIRKLEEGEVPTEGQIIPDGWEHEHCALCWQTISCLETDENFAYTDGNDWICETCYEKYIASGFGKRLG